MANEGTTDEEGTRSEAVNDAAKTKEPLGTRVKNIMAKYGLDATTLKLMFKFALLRVPTSAEAVTDSALYNRGSLPPTIAIAMLQSTAVSATFTTIGYEIPIVTVLAMAILPRGKYLQNLVLNIVSICVGSAVALLMLWSAVEARQHTSSPGPSGTVSSIQPPYNSSQSAVCAIWLFVNIWAVNLLRAKLPSFNLPVIIYSILTSISATYGPLMASTQQALVFVRELLTAMLLALGIATGVSLLVFPTTSRDVVFKQFTSAIGLLRRSVVLQGAYLQALEREDIFTLEPVEAAVGRDSAAAHERRKSRKRKPPAEPDETKERAAAKQLRAAISQLADSGGKLHAELKFAKRDIAWGKLDAKDLGTLVSLFRRIFIPMYALLRMFDKLQKRADLDVELA